MKNKNAPFLERFVLLALYAGVGTFFSTN